MLDRGAARQKEPYASVNRAREDVARNKRLDHKERKEIGFIRAITADIDIPKLESDDLNKQRQHFQRLKTKLLEEVTPEIAKLECPPTVIVDSGGGLQAWWVFDQSIQATPDNAEKSEGVGRAISELLQANFPEYKLDNVSDLARVMRLPGTINIPDANKRKRGRSAAPATVLSDHCSGNTYSLDELAAWAPPTSKRQSKSSEEAWPEIDMGLVKSAADYEELPEELRAKFERAREHDPALRGLWEGNPNRGQKDTSRSGFVFALAGRLVRDDQFTATEFGQFVWVWEHGYLDEPDKIDQRLIGRAWKHAKENYAKKSSASGIDPCGDGEQTAQEWEDPTDFWTGESEPPDLPEGVVPEIVERFARDRGRRLGVEAGAPAACLITSLAAAISARNNLQVRQKDPLWTVKPILWTAIIAPSGSNKSATLSYAMAPVEALERSYRKEYAAAKHLYDEQERAKKDKKGEPTDPRTMELPEPVCRRKIIKDATVEGAALLLSKNRDGLFYACDELSTFLGRIDLYKNRAGADRPYWLEAKEGRPYSQDRKTSDPIVVEHNAVSILGGIQPDKIKEQAQDMATDGLMQRFLPIYLKQWGAGEDDYPDEELDKIIAKLAIVISKAEPSRFKFTPEADLELRRIQHFGQRQRERFHGSKFQEWLAKLPNEFGRLALAFHYIQWAASSAGERGARPPEMIPLGTATMARRFLEEFVFPHASEFYRSMLDRSASEDHAAWIAGYALSRKSITITRREIQRSYKALKDPSKTGLLSYAMSFLETYGWVKPRWGKGRMRGEEEERESRGVGGFGLRDSRSQLQSPKACDTPPDHGCVS